MRKNKSSRVLLTLWLLISVLALCIAAEESVSMQLGSATIRPGETAVLALRLEENPGVAAMQLVLHCDDGLELVSCAAGADFGGATIIQSPAGVVPPRILWATTGANKANGEILRLSFRIDKSIPSGEFNVQVECKSANDEAENPIVIPSASGKIVLQGWAEEEKTTISVTDATADARSSITVQLAAANRFSAAVGELSLVYDADVLQLEQLSPAAQYSSVMRADSKTGRIAWASLNEFNEGVLAEATFKLLSTDAADYPTSVAVSGALYNLEEEKIEGVLFKSGEISLTVVGDLNSDGQLSLIDVLLLLRGVVNGTPLENADMNADGKLSLLDVLRLMKRCVNPEVAYLIRFDANGGEVEASPMRLAVGENFGTLPSPYRFGYTPNGWYTEAAGGKQITESSLLTKPENQTLYAHWTANTHTVTLDANGGECTTASVLVNYGGTFGELPAATRPNYTFDGWYTDRCGGTKISESTMVSAEEQTLYAHWVGNTYTVRFYTAFDMIVLPQTVTYGSTYGELPEVTFPGYTFYGWCIDPWEKITPSTIVEIAEDHTLNAYWTNNTYTVSFDAVGGECAVEAVEVTYNSEYAMLPKPIRAGYTFDGWYTEDGTEITDSSVLSVAKDHTLFARWSEIVSAVTFNANGGTCAASSKIVKCGEAYGELPVATRPGYAFDGWYTAANVRVTADTEVADVQNQVLYAHWTGNTYAAMFTATDGTVGIGFKYVTCGEKYGELPVATRVGYMHDGWYTEKVGGRKITASDIVSIAENQMLYAHWTVNAYKATWTAPAGVTIVVKRTSSPNKGATIGALSSGAAIYYGDVLSITYTKVDCYTIKTTGKTSVTVAGNVTSADIYATAELNPVLEGSSLPSGAQIVKEWWTYTEKEYAKSDKSALTGWTYESKERTDWSAWRDWQTTNPTDGARDVEHRSVYDHTEYHYYRWTNSSHSAIYSYKTSSYSCTILEEKWFTYTLIISPEKGGNVCYDYKDSRGDKWVTRWFAANYGGNSSVDRTFTRDVNRDEWRYRDPIYTYTYYRYTDKTSGTAVSATSLITNVKHHVQYRMK